MGCSDRAQHNGWRRLVSTANLHGGRRMICHCVLVGFDKCMGDYRCEEEEWWLAHGSHANIVAEKLWLQRCLPNTIAASRATWKEKALATWRLKNEVHTVRPGVRLPVWRMARRGKTRSVGWTLDMPRVWIRGSIMKPIYRIWSCSRCYHKEISVAKKPRCTMCKRSEIALRMNVIGWLKWRRNWIGLLLLQ